MPCTSIIPDRHIVLPPLKSYLRIVVLRDEVKEVWKQEVGFVLGDAVDALRESLVDEN
jgi:hypothetical protein